MQKVIPFFWFDSNAEEAVNFYISVFKDSKIGSLTRYDEAAAKATGRPIGSVLTASFQLLGQDFVALNGGPLFKFTPAISFIVNCKEKEEVKRLWDKLSAGGSVMMPLDKYPFSEYYGWLQDKYGLSWQLILVNGEIKQNIIPSLLFVGDVCGKAEEAINFYNSIFKNSKVGNILRHGANMKPDKEGTVLFADFLLENERFAAMDSAHAHNFTFNEAVSFVVNCETQNEVDHYWNDLIAGGGQESMCGWLKDKFGVSWQIVPTVLSKYFSDKDAAKSQRAMKAMLQMKKLDIAVLGKAFEGK